MNGDEKKGTTQAGACADVATVRRVHVSVLGYGRVVRVGYLDLPDRLIVRFAWCVPPTRAFLDPFVTEVAPDEILEEWEEAGGP